MRSLLLVAAITAAYALLRGWPTGVPVLLRLGIAVLLLAPAIAAWVPRKRPGRPAAARRRPGWIDTLSLGAAFLAVEAAFLLFLGLAPRPLESIAGRLDTAIRNERKKPAAAPEHPDGTPSGNWLWHRPGARRLAQHGSYRPGNRPELFLRTRDRNQASLLLRGRIYVSAFSLEQFDHAEWSVPSAPPLTATADPAGFVRFADRPGLPIPHQVFHASDPSGQTPLIGLQGVIAAEISPLRQLGDGLHLLPPLPPEAPGYDYLVISKPETLDDLPADARPVATGSPQHLLDLPATGNLPIRLRELATLAAGTGTTTEQLGNLRNHLRTTLDYSLDIDNPRNLDPLENFLFAEQRGHCELFATAGAMLARAIGVPARVTYGWSGGRYYDSPNLFVFRARDAHAWTEVWIENHGWVVLDPTPPGAGQVPAASVAGQNEAVPGSGDADPADSADSLLAERELPASALWFLAALVAAAIVLAVIRGLTTRRRHASEAAAGAPSPVRPPDYLLEFRIHSARAGHPLPTGRTLHQHRAALGPAAPAVVTELVNYHYATRYEFAPRDPAHERQFIRQLRAWNGRQGPFSERSG